jgi:cell wall-associated NlpC family hydrolase
VEKMIKKVMIFQLAVLLMLSGCGNAQNYGANPEDNGDAPLGSLGESEKPMEIQGENTQTRTLTVFSRQGELDQVKAYTINGETYLPLMQVLELLNFKVLEKGGMVQAGFTDVFIEITKDSDQAVIEGEQKTLSAPIISQDNQTLITMDSLKDVLGADTEVTATENKVTINIPYENEEYGFPEDVNLDDLPDETELPAELPEDLPVISSGIAENITRLGLKYRGTSYVFGAPSGYTRVFDCSSFTQYLYEKAGVDLPRISRHQAKLGRYVPVKDLRAGDLLFFYWPGRFQSNKIVGHVGIYIGSGYMLHSAPNTPYTKDGVQVMNLRTNPFKNLYLGAKRVG